MSWRSILWVATVALVVLTAGSAMSFVRLVRTPSAGGRRLWRLLGAVACAAVFAACLYAAWFAWPVFTGRRPTVRDPVSAMALGRVPVTGVHSILVVVAHPDDAEWYAGGTLALAVRAGSKVTVVVATNGEKGRAPAGTVSLGDVRKREQQEAARAIGYAETVFLEMADRSLSREVALADRIRDAWDSVRPDLVFTFDCESPARPYIHPDHQAVGRAVLHILDGGGRQATAYLFSSASPDAVVDITEALGQKTTGIEAHRTQFGERGGGAAGRNRGPGAATGYAYTEMFRVRHPRPQ